MHIIKIGPMSNCIHHKAHAFLSGDLITFYCDQCPEFKLVINWKTGDIEQYHSAPNNICHTGIYVPFSGLLGGN